MKKFLNKRLVEFLISLVKRGEISSISVNDKIIDITNYNTIPIIELIQSKIRVSKKYIHKLVTDEFTLDKVVESFLEEPPHCYLLTENNKFRSFNVTHHSAKALLYRFIYVYLIDDLKFELGKLELIYSKYLNTMCDILENEDLDKLGNNKVIHSLIKELMVKSSLHTIKNSGRIRDIKAFNRRNNQYDNSNRYFVHPYLFIIEDDILKTVELYSSSFDFRHYNKETKEKDFKNKLLIKLCRRD